MVNYGYNSYSFKVRGEEVVAVKVLFTYDYGKENMNKLRQLGYEVTVANEKDLIYSYDIKDTEVLVCYNPFDTLDISLMNSLKWIQVSSIGIDQLPVKIAKDKKITVTNNRGGYSIPMGEWVVMKTLELLKNSVGMYKNQAKKLWKMDTGILELYGKTVGFVGTGSIAIESAKRLQGFGVKIFGLNTAGTKVEYFDRCFSVSEIDSMLSGCDVVVLTIPSTAETHHLISKDRFNCFKEGAYLINVARGNIIDENALIENLSSGRIAGAALDVFEEEPLKSDNLLWTLDNVIITPHNSWISEMRNIRRWNLIHENLRRYISGEELVNVVNLNKGY
jgi:phosphoglycerate dehydrogenase-like enzyme